MTASDLLAFRGPLQAEFEAILPALITLPNVAGSIPCAGGSLKETGESLRLGGEFAEFELTFRVRKALLPAVPSPGTRIGFNGATYRIMRVANPTSDVAYYIGCDSIQK